MNRRILWNYKGAERPLRDVPRLYICVGVETVRSVSQTFLPENDEPYGIFDREWGTFRRVDQWRIRRIRRVIWRIDGGAIMKRRCLFLAAVLSVFWGGRMVFAEMQVRLFSPPEAYVGVPCRYTVATVEAMKGATLLTVEDASGRV